MRKDAPLAVELPAPERDNPGWARIGAIAAVGFLVGVAWPRVMGVRLGPAAPGESAAAASAAASSSAVPPPSVLASAASVGSSASAKPTPLPPPAAVAQGPRSPEAEAAAQSQGPLHVTVAKGAMLSCKDADGETHKGKACGSAPGLDALVRPKLRALSSCTGLEGQTGKLSVVVTADVANKKLSYDIGKSSTLKDSDAAAACLKASFHGMTPPATAHEHARYTVAYAAVLSTSKP